MGQAFSKRRHVWRSRITPVTNFKESHKKDQGHVNTHWQSNNAMNYSLDPLPTEMLLHVFSFLELKSYIVCHAVCKEWRNLLPLTDIHPVRRRMLSLFRRMLANPHFLETRRWIVKNLKHFDRQAYIDSLLSQYPAIPAEFKFWILEWPARMAIPCMWPALPFIQAKHSTPDTRFGVNWLAHNFTSPGLLALIFKHATPGAKYVPALLISKDFRTTWLIFDQEETHLFGRVFVNDHQQQERSGILPRTWTFSEPYFSRYGNDISLDDDEIEYQPYVNRAFTDWISYQEHEWTTWMDFLSVSFPRKQKQRIEASRIRVPPKYVFCSTVPSELPSPPWQKHHEHQYQNLLMG